MYRALPKTPREVCLQLAARLRARRLQLRLPQETLALRTGLSLGTIKHLESRPWTCSLENLVRAGAALQLNAGFAKLFEWRPASYAEFLETGRAPRQRAPSPTASGRRRLELLLFGAAVQGRCR